MRTLLLLTERKGKSLQYHSDSVGKEGQTFKSGDRRKNVFINHIKKVEKQVTQDTKAIAQPLMHVKKGKYFFICFAVINVFS